MRDYDALLQAKLDELEQGADLQTVINSLPEDARDLAALIRLADAVRGVPHPQPAQADARRQQVIDAAASRQAETGTQPAPQPMSRSIPRPAAQPKPRLPQMPRRLPFGRPAGAWMGLAAGVMGLILLVAAGLAASAWLTGRGTATARIQSVTGAVQVAENPAGTAWRTIDPGYQVRKGDRLRTLGASEAALVFNEGTRTTLLANADVTFVELNGGAGQTIQVKINQTAGAITNQVTPFNGNPRSFFIVQTPAGTASVHGTRFDVRVDPNGQAQFAVTSGVVRVQHAGQEVTLTAGQATAADAGGAIDPAAYQFSVQGSLTDRDDAAGQWTVSGVSFAVTPETAITGEPQLGDMVQVTGRILADQTRAADSIQPAQGSDQTAYFTGALETNGGDTWQIGGMTVKINSETALDSDLAPGTPVKVTFNRLEDGTYLALKIESLLERPDEPAPTATVTTDPQAQPGYAFTPNTLTMLTCGSSSIDVNGTLANTASQPKDYAAAVRLSYRIDEGGAYVSGVELTPTTFERIEAGQAVNFGLHLRTTEAWAAAGETAVIKLRVIIASAANRPDHLDGSLAVTIQAGCQPTASPTVTQTPAASPTDTAAPAPTATAPTPEDLLNGTCTGANPHPTGMKLAQRYGVPYAEIMGWFCQHYGFGEIDMAYSLARQWGRPVEEIFALRASGLGWGQIKKMAPANGGDNNNQGQNNGNGKDKKDKKK